MPRNRGTSRKSLHTALVEKGRSTTTVQTPTIEEQSMPVDTRLSVHFHPPRHSSRNELRDVIDWAMKRIVAVLSAPRGDQGGWEAGARGL